MKLILYVLANSVAIKVADWLVPGFTFRGDWSDLIIAAAALGLVNSLIKPVIKLISLPLIIVTLGLFTVLINIALLNLVDHFLFSLAVNGFWAAFWSVIVISLTNNLVMSAFKHKEN